MRVDMSAAGITARLEEMEDLWRLSVKLIKAGKTLPRPKGQVAERALKIYDSIRQVLLKDWDPLNIADEAQCGDEYDAYIARVYRILIGTRTESDLIECLRRIENDEMGIAFDGGARLQQVAQELLALSVRLELEK